MQNKFKYLLLFVVCVGLFGFLATFYVANSKVKKDLASCQEQSGVIEKKINDLCGATNNELGWSVNSLMCNGKPQLCVCGNPDTLMR